MKIEYTDVSLPATEAKKLVHKLRRGRSFRVMVQGRAPIADNPDREFPTLATVSTSHSDMLRYIDDAYGNFEKRGGLVPIHYCDTLLFVG